jgi:hypothetical protein
MRWCECALPLPSRNVRPIAFLPSARLARKRHWGAPVPLAGGSSALAPSTPVTATASSFPTHNAPLLTKLVAIDDHQIGG